MNRTEYPDRHRKTLGTAIMVSIAAHAALLALLKVDLDVTPQSKRQRATQLIELADAWQDRPLEVVLLNDVSPAASASSKAASTFATSVGADGLETLPVAAEAKLALVGTVPSAAELDLAPAEPVTVASLTFKTRRGVVLRIGGPVGPSDAAADDERWWDGGGRGGIGISIVGGDCGAPGAFGIPVIGGRGGGIRSLPRVGTGRGVLGRTDGFGSAINRVGPSGS